MLVGGAVRSTKAWMLQSSIWKDQVLRGMASGSSAAVGAEAPGGARLGRGVRESVGVVWWCPDMQTEVATTGHHALKDDVRGPQ